MEIPVLIYIINIIALILILVPIYYTLFIIIKNYTQDKSKEANTIELYNLYKQIDPEDCRKKIDDLIDTYITEYSLYHFATQEVLYIRSDQVEKMVKNITETAYINLSDLYVFYIRMIINVDSEDSVLGYLRDRVKTRALLYVSEINKTN